jgi:hypothetical protein
MMTLLVVRSLAAEEGELQTGSPKDSSQLCRLPSVSMAQGPTADSGRLHHQMVNHCHAMFSPCNIGNLQRVIK